MVSTTLAGLPQEEKIRIRRDELADAALATLGRLGYARTSLREIARDSTLSHGVVHYYFGDKLELIAYCVTRYKDSCVRRYDHIVAGALDADSLAEAFADELARTLVVDAAMHRLWYDMRAQSMFEPQLRESVVAIDTRLEEMIAAVVRRHAALRDTPAPDTRLAYRALDGLFENALVRSHTGDPDAAATLRRDVIALLPRL